jgi:hypothetical protein
VLQLLVELTNTQILEKRIAALSLDSFMSTIEKEGEGIDDHVSDWLDEYDKTILYRCHAFSHERQIILKEKMVSWAKPWMSVVRFETTPELKEEALHIFYDVVDNEECPYSIMFWGEGDSLMLGPFFYRNSRLRDALQKYIMLLSIAPTSHVEIGKNIWRIIQNHGGLTALLAIWDDLIESTILVQMRLIDPYCLDED